jgi:hypothetical protein
MPISIKDMQMFLWILGTVTMLFSAHFNSMLFLLNTLKKTTDTYVLSIKPSRRLRQHVVAALFVISRATIIQITASNTRQFLTP